MGSSYDFRNRKEPPYSKQSPMYGRPATNAPHPIYGQPSSLYPRVGQHSGGNRNPSFYPTSSTTGIGIRVAMKPEYRIRPPPPLSPQVGDIPRSTFHFDFDLEKKILAEAQKESQNWSSLGLENLPSRGSHQASMASSGDPVMNKYIALGLNREAVPLAVANYGDNPAKVKEFADGYTRLKEMGFSSNSAADALLMNDNDTSKAIPHLLNNPS
ncbi:uncharacterized protein LOC132051695 [Lycium ferocissimum]|uniref:uncharacterized protein LOC132051695 n=1 Tax=Lycium ferocissimum TaxID=112874 RepID=UPI002814A64E|nr:uncharacterized protein LOC132051695 [Lycium ferocissimum]